MLGGFHENKKAGKMHNARHVRVGKLDTALGVKFGRHFEFTMILMAGVK